MEERRLFAILLEKRWLRRNSFRGLRCGVLQQRHAEGEIQRSRRLFVDSCNDRCRAGWRRQGFPHARLFVWRTHGCCESGSKDWLRADNSASGGTYGVPLHIHGARRENLQSFSECVAIQRAMCSEYSVGGDNEIQESKADICFAMERNDDVITGWCYTFGAADCDVYKTILYIRTASGKMVKGEYDVTQQINSQKGHLKNVDIVIDTDLDLDKHGGSSGSFGFDPSVDEWGDIESDIIL